MANLEPFMLRLLGQPKSRGPLSILGEKHVRYMEIDFSSPFLSLLSAILNALDGKGGRPVQPS